MVNIDKIKSGDKDETEKLIRDFTPQVAILGIRLSRGDPASREDLIQAGLYALVEAAGAYDGAKGASFSTFALVCAKRRMIDEWRKLTPGGDPPEPLDSAKDKPAGTDMTDDIAKRDILRQLPDILSAAELKVFFLKMRGASYAEIARSLNIGEKAVDNALKRARKKIHDLVDR
ncbi:MAG: sigma-70 family RNA polymerase sigma factor [Clostridiales bacterium]|jgi:RNA polymerase sporulation-specific sigma factor|nr:sigma-70 family RNA polymerase sigma factor [Clostridiales bacterium]